MKLRPSSRARALLCSMLSLSLKVETAWTVPALDTYPNDAAGVPLFRRTLATDEAGKANRGAGAKETRWRYGYDWEARDRRPAGQALADEAEASSPPSVLRRRATGTTTTRRARCRTAARRIRSRCLRRRNWAGYAVWSYGWQCSNSYYRRQCVRYLDFGESAF